MKVKANDLFESYLKTICNSQAQFEAINNLHKLYFESEMGKEVECEDDADCCNGECKDGKCECKDGKCECKDGKKGKCECNEKGINEAVGEDGIDIQAEAEKNGLSVPEYQEALEMFTSN